MSESGNGGSKLIIILFAAAIVVLGAYPNRQHLQDFIEFVRQESTVYARELPSIERRTVREPKIRRIPVPNVQTTDRARLQSSDKVVDRLHSKDRLELEELFNDL